MSLKALTAAALLSVCAAGATQAAAPRLHHTDPEIFKDYNGAGAAPAGAGPIYYMSDGKSYATLSDDRRSIVSRDIASGRETATLLSLDNTRGDIRLQRIDGFSILPGGAQIMIWTGSKPVYRRSIVASYYLYETHSRLLRPLSENHPVQRSPKVSPDGMCVAFVDPSDNNIYIRKLNYWTEVAVTADGAYGSIINGATDWTYEEEFSVTELMSWSPDSRTLSFVRSDESDVPLYTMPVYEGTCHPDKAFALYPGQFSYKYPVAGQPNSRVSLHAYDIDNRKLTDITLPGGDIEYIPRIHYAYADDRLMVVALNRDQNRMDLYAVNPRSGVARSILTEQSDTWLSTPTYEEISWQPDGFVIISGRSGYDQLYHYTYSGSLTRTLTSGNTDVTAYYGYDAARRCHYYQSAPDNGISRVVNRLDAKGNVTAISEPHGWSSASFSPDMNWYTATYSNARTAPVTTLNSTASGKRVRTLADNTGAYQQRYADDSKREFLQIPGGEPGLMLNAYMVKPASFDPSRRYPVVMYLYNGPGSQQVADRWSVDWTMVFAKRGYIVVCVDGRGTGYRGRDFMTTVYKRLGYCETIDQIAAARHVASLPYVDPDRIGIHGWSYGGYETLMAVTDPSGNSPYAAAVAVAPVTDWRFYDTAYTERYMSTPAANASGYEQSAPLNRTASLSCPLLIMHGTADDNVHLLNTLQFVSQLESQSNYCDMLLFPNMNHSINGCGVQRLVYARMLDYFDSMMPAGRR